MTLPKNNNGMRKTREVNIWLVAFIAILIASILNWFMVINLAAPKSDYASEINRINNSMGHMDDSATSLDNFTNYQNTQINDLSDNTQAQFDEVNGSITDTNNKITQTQNDLLGVEAKANNLQTQTNDLAAQSTQLGNQLTTVSQEGENNSNALGTLSATVNGLPAGLQITPSVSSGTINLSINSGITQTIAFKLEFRPTSDVPQVATMDAALAALYNNPPVTLTAGSSVRGDYTLYWNPSDSLYHLGLITFITMGTSLTAGANTKSITYTTSGTYEILITPIYPTGTSTGSW